MPRKPKTTLPAFTPVPRLCDRSNGWKPEVQRAFIEALAETGSVKAAARRVGRSEVGAYALRRHPAAEEFRAAWQAALDLGIQKIEDVAMDRALNGWEVPVYSYGRLIGTRTKYNDRLLMFMLRNRAPGRFTDGGAKGLNAVDKQQIARLKKQWRKEWAKEQEREQAALGDRDEQATYDAIHAKLRTAQDNWLNMMSDKTRAAYDQFKACEAEDKATHYRHLGERDTRAKADANGGQPPIPLPPPGCPFRDPPTDDAEGEPKVRSVKDDGW